MSTEQQDAPSPITVERVGPDDAAVVVHVIHRAFADRPALDPPATAMDETVETVAATLAEHGGLLARDPGGQPLGALLLAPDGAWLGLRRVSVVPEAQRRGVAALLAEAAEAEARRSGRRRLRLVARAELPGTVTFWQRNGYREVSRDGTSLMLAKEVPVHLTVPTADDMRAVGERLATRLQAGDLLILSGDLGAGKTTFTQGLGAGLGVRGDVTSPTFVISRVHPSTVGGPALVHVDAYRLGGLEELDDLDLDVSVADSVTVVEWGSGVAEGLADDRLEVSLTRPHGDETAPEDSGTPDEPRQVRLVAVGARWVGSDLADLVT